MKAMNATTFDGQKLERLRNLDAVLRKEIRGQNQVFATRGLGGAAW